MHKKFSEKVKGLVGKMSGVTHYDSKKAPLGSLADMRNRKNASRGPASKGPFRPQ